MLLLGQGFPKDRKGFELGTGLRTPLVVPPRFRLGFYPRGQAGDNSLGIMRVRIPLPKGAPWRRGGQSIAVPCARDG